jgi:AraC-like DNA-binding protein
MYTLFAPAPPLRPYIDLYWRIFTQDPAAALRERIIVDGQADILFNLGAPYHRFDPTDPTRDALLTVSNLDAQRRYPILIAQSGAMHLLGVRFRPGGLSAFIRIPLHKLTDLAIDAGDIFGAALRELDSRLFDAAPDATAQIALLDAFFARHLHALPASSTSAYALAACIEQACGQVSIRALSHDLGYSIRTLDRRFTAAFGYSPKFYARIIRFRTVTAHLSAHPYTPLIDLALAHGFTDQAHFTHEFSALAGQSPAAFRAMLSP